MRKLTCRAVLGIFLIVGVGGAPSFAADTDVTQLTLSEISQGYASGKYTSEKITRAFLARIEKYESSYNACTSFNPHAVDDARAIDQLRAQNATLGPLAGIPIIIKESIDVAGLASTAGWAPLDPVNKATGGIELLPQSDAPVVQRLRKAGAIIIGKGNIPAFSADAARANTSSAGPTYNAVNKRFVPGASSSGVATAVAASFVVAGLGEETGGSIQNPAAAQSLVGVKPTFALVPNSGVVPLGGSTRDSVGPITTSVKDAALILDIIAGYSIDDPKTVAAIGNIPLGGYASKLSLTALRGKRIGLYGFGWGHRRLSAETRALYDNVIDVLKAQGAITVEDPFAPTEFATLAPPAAFKPNFYGLQTTAFDLDRYLQHLGPNAAIHSLEQLKAKTGKDPFAADGPLIISWKGAYSDDPVLDMDIDIYADGTKESARQKMKAIFEKLQSVKTPVVPESVSMPPDLSAFTALQQKYLSLFDRVMEENQLSCLIFPQMFMEIPAQDDILLYPATTVPQINILGLPGVIVPAGQYKSGAPFGVIIIGKKWSEAELLGIAYDYERATQARVIPKLAE